MRFTAIIPVRDAGLELDGVWTADAAALRSFLFSSIFLRNSSTLRSRSSWLGYNQDLISFNYFTKQWVSVD